jgi:hypothetical protein
LNGQTVTAQRTFTATFNNGGTNFPYFGGFADVTARINGNGTLTFSGLTVTTGAPHCGSSAVAAGWSVIAIYGSANERLRAVNVFDGLQFFRGNALTLNPDGFRIPATNFDGRMAIVAWEGDPGNSTVLDSTDSARRCASTVRLSMTASWFPAATRPCSRTTAPSMQAALRRATASTSILST